MISSQGNTMDVLLSEETWQRLVAQFDADGDNALDIDEFTALVQALKDGFAPNCTLTTEAIAGHPAFGSMRPRVTAAELRTAAVQGAFGELALALAEALRTLTAQPALTAQPVPQHPVAGLPCGCLHYSIKGDLYHGRQVSLDVAPPAHVSHTAHLETITSAGGISSVGQQLHSEAELAGRQLRIASMVAGNSGRPGGACGFEDGTVRKIHAHHETQEEDVVSNWLVTTCHTAGQPITDGAPNGTHPLANALYQQTICRQWGMSNPTGVDTLTVQHVDYTRARRHSFYGDAWVVRDAALSDTRVDATNPRTFDVARHFPTTLVFVAGPNCGAWGRNARSTTRRTYNSYAEADYGLFRGCVQAALHAGLVAMARDGSTVALLAHVSAGLYAGPHRDKVRADFEGLVNEILDTPCATPSGPVPLGRYFERVILPTLS